jgi:hypothetical protein
MPSVTYYERLNNLPDFHKIRYWDASQKLLSKCEFGENWFRGSDISLKRVRGNFSPYLSYCLTNTSVT